MRDPTTPDALYDVAFSYASEDREYVERVAAAIGPRARVFYDRHEQVETWGKDLRTCLAEIYARSARFCVLFISTHYVGKVWTGHEHAAARARAQLEPGAYLLPARFDDTPLPGLPDTVAHVDLRGLAPEAFAEIILLKVRRTRRRARRWVAAASAALSVLVAGGWILFGASSVAQAAPDGGTAASAGTSIVQTLEADGPGSNLTVDKGMNVDVAAGSGNVQQVVKAKGGANLQVKDGMNVNVGDAKGKGARPH